MGGSGGSGMLDCSEMKCGGFGGWLVRGYLASNDRVVRDNAKLVSSARRNHIAQA